MMLSNKTAASYLNEAKECFVYKINKERSSGKLSIDLQQKLNQIKPDDYIEERHLKSGELLIFFQGLVKGELIGIQLEINTEKKERCKRISVYEILE